MKNAVSVLGLGLACFIIPASAEAGKVVCQLAQIFPDGKVTVMCQHDGSQGDAKCTVTLKVKIAGEKTCDKSTSFTWARGSSQDVFGDNKCQGQPIAGLSASAAAVSCN
jgi:hypothetical protein